MVQRVSLRSKVIVDQAGHRFVSRRSRRADRRARWRKTTSYQGDAVKAHDARTHVSTHERTREHAEIFDAKDLLCEYASPENADAANLRFDASLS